MIVLIFPFLLGAAAFIVGGVGVAEGVVGVSKIEKAKKLGKKAQKRYKEKQKSVEKALQVTQNLAEQYGQLQIQVKLETIERFIAFIERIGQQASQSNLKFLAGLEGISPQQIEEYKAATLEAESTTSGGFKAVGAAYAAGQGTIALVGLFGTASTGAAIGGLSGAAAWNATLAWLGGGSLAAGGGGMALGSLVLGGIAVGPALMIGGLVLGGEGEKALTEARKYEAKVNTEIAKLDTFEAFLDQVQRRITELKDLVEKLNIRAIDGLVELESRPFVVDQDAQKFQQVGLLVKALVEIMKTPVLDTEGNLNSATVGLDAVRLKYQSIADVLPAQQKPTVTEQTTSTSEYQSFCEGLTESVELEMIAIPGGSFVMGSTEHSKEKPEHEVTVSAFHMAKYPITQEQYEAVIGNNPSRFKKGGKYPVEDISWFDAQEFCAELSLKTGKVYRLPTEAEWEYAARAGTQTLYYFGDDKEQLEKYAWRKCHSNKKTHSVGQKLPNQWGLYDMLGNVWEWCEDNWHDNYNGAPIDGSAWIDNEHSDSHRIIRGGSFRDNSPYCNCTYRNHNRPSKRYDNHGFRVVVVATKAK